MRVVRNIVHLATAGVPLSFLCAGTPPPLTLQPLPQRVISGHRTTLRGGSSDPRARFSWERMGLTLPGQSTPKLEIRNARPSDAGIYQLVAGNHDEEANQPALGEMASNRVSVEVVMRPEAPGVVDLDFDDVGLTDGQVRALVPGGDGGVVMGGSFSYAGARGLLRLRADGSLDPTFTAKPGAGGDTAINAIVTHGDGWIVGGDFTSFHGVERIGLARLQADGQLDASFSSSAITGAVHALAIQEIDGEPRVLAGLFKHPWLVRLHADGRIDETFDARLKSSGLNGPVTALAVQPSDGAVVIGGWFSYSAGGWPFQRLGRLEPDGRPDADGFPGHSAALGTDSAPAALCLDDAGNILVAGPFSRMHGNDDYPYLARLGQDGKLDPTFSPSPSHRVNAVACGDGGSYLVGGEFSKIGGHRWRSVARLNAIGGADPNWTSPAFDGEALCLARGAGGRLFVGGKFGQPHARVVALRNRPFEEPPRLLAAASPQELTLGMGGALRVTALAGPDASYTWHKLSSHNPAFPVAITGTGELMIARVSAEDSGTYEVRISSTHGSTLVGPIDVFVRPRPAGAREHRRALPVNPVLPELKDQGEVTVPFLLPALKDVREVRVTLALKHGDTNDLDVKLVAPGRPPLFLVDVDSTLRRGRDFDYTVFADQAEVKISDAIAPYIGTFRPSAASPGLASLRGDHPAGEWSLKIYDHRTDGTTGTLVFAAIDIFGPPPPITAGLLATRPCPDGLPELTLDASAHRAWLYHWLPDAVRTPSYERAHSLTDWRSMNPAALYRLRRNEDQTALAELILPDDTLTPAGFFRAKW